MRWHWLCEINGKDIYLRVGHIPDGSALAVEEDFLDVREATPLEVAQVSRIMDGVFADCLLRAEEEERKADTTGREATPPRQDDTPVEDKFSERARIELSQMDRGGVA